ncbi:MAG: MOSC domain-containing protein [Acidobacteriota bacterium]|nr:MOSC domain-containing protein [Acidobacteriota bacterium]
MPPLTVSALHVYPLKSCRGLSLDRATVGRMGLQYDRQWMFVDERGMFVAQRGDGRLGVEVRTLCLVRTALAGGLLRVTAPDMPPLELPLAGLAGAEVPVQVWQSRTIGIDQGPEAEAWATTYLGRERPGRYRLVRMPDEGHRLSKKGPAELAFADGYPFLIISEASLEDLNRRLAEPLPMNRFRPNIVLRGCAPYGEDTLDALRIGSVELMGMPLCPRCPIPTTNQETGERGKEPLRTLATYRRGEDGSVLFGRNFSHRTEGEIAVGDEAVHVQGAAVRSSA